LGETEPDQQTLLLRRLLLQSGDNDSLRRQALIRVLRSNVLGATWPDADDALRTLTNSDGEQAMPLFSGIDLLRVAAGRFGWAGPDGSFPCRTLSARQAFSGALSQNVDFVVIDICAEHSVEFSRDEITEVLAKVAETRDPSPPAQAPIPRALSGPLASPSPALRPAGMRADSGALGTLGMKTPLLEEIDLPFQDRAAQKPARGMVADEVGAPRAKRALTRPDPRAEPSRPPESAPVSRLREPAAVTVMTNREPPQHAQPNPQALVETPQPAREALVEAPQPAPQTLLQAPQPAQTAPHAASLPDLSGLPNLSDRPAAPFAATGGRKSTANVGFDALSNEGPGARATPPVLGQPEPEARPAALEAAILVTQLAKVAGDANTQKAAIEVASMLKNMATKGVVAEAKPAPAPKAGAAQTMANVIAEAFFSDAATGPKVGRQVRHRNAEAAVAAAQAEADAQASADSAASAASITPAASSGEPALAASALRPLEVGLDEGLLQNIANTLRNYPEVEWACEVSDGSEVPVVGVRIDPSFLKREAEISAEIAAAGEARGTALTVLVLATAPQMREARARGNLFFPWRKRSPKG
jgi:hypothetical protein